LDWATEPVWTWWSEELLAPAFVLVPGREADHSPPSRAEVKE